MANPAVPVGDVVELVRHTDHYSRLKPGTRGVVSLVDQTGTVHVAWENGSNLGMIERAGDAFLLIEKAGER